MSVYTPDCWKIIKITPKDSTIKPYFRILASWGGSYLYGASWKISSGIETFNKNGEYYYSDQNSGSIYKLHESAERMSGIMQSILGAVEQDSKQIKVEVYTLDMFLGEFNA